MKKLLIACAATLMAGTAYAADAVIEEVPVSIEIDGFSWTGFYVGIHGGYSWADGEWTAPEPPGAAYNADADLDGFLVGVHAGAQYQFQNNVVLGVEIDADYRDADETANIVLTPPGEVVSDINLRTEINWTGSARLRAGYAMDRWMPYVTGGFAFADYDVSLGGSGIPVPPPPGASFSKTSVGWTAGVGAEYAFTDNLIFRAEYRYSDFGDEDVFLIFTDQPQTYELDSHDLTIGVSYKF